MTEYYINSIEVIIILEIVSLLIELLCHVRANAA